jgi:hypothetical protein
MTDHDGAESESHEEQRERLQTIKVAQKIPPGVKMNKIIAGAKNAEVRSACCK